MEQGNETRFLQLQTMCLTCSRNKNPRQSMALILCRGFCVYSIALSEDLVKQASQANATLQKLIV